MEIAGRKISREDPVYIVAELGAAHNGQYGRAINLMHEAKRAGADAFKIQIFSAETITFDGSGPEFTISEGPWAGWTLSSLYKACAMPREWYGEIFEQGRAIDLPVFASVFSPEDVQIAETFGCPAYKIASFELIDTGLIQAATATGKPVIISTGMASHDEIVEAHLDFIQAGGNINDVCFMHCVSEYPTPARSANLKRIRRMPGLWGLSDHTIGSIAAVTSVGIGARMIEKHITLSRGDKGPDDGFASEPIEFAAMVSNIRTAEEMMAPADEDKAAEHSTLRRSLYAVRDIEPGELFTEDNVRSIRPGSGLAPKKLKLVLGNTSPVAIKAGTPLTSELAGLA